MSADITIRRATISDAQSISHVVCQTLAGSNANDYSSDVILRIQRAFSQQGVREVLERRPTLVACKAGEIAGTAGLEKDIIKSVFVLPRAQGLGIGRALLQHIEDRAERDKQTVLRLRSSITARYFYEAMGYHVVNTVIEADELTYAMQKVIR